MSMLAYTTESHPSRTVEDTGFGFSGREKYFTIHKGETLGPGCRSSNATESMTHGACHSEATSHVLMVLLP
jgi:hypothetical protein